MISSSLPYQSIHNDVLSATPSSKEDVVKLIEEIKRRAKCSISSKNYPESIQLYTKAIEVSASDDVSGKSILHGNISMCYNAMNKGTDALDHANLSISNDPGYVKAYYRKAMAFITLKQYHQARDALLEGLNVKPDDKEIKQQLDKVQSEIVKSGTNDQSSSTNSTTSIVEKAPTVLRTNSSSSSSSSSTTAAATTSTTSIDQIDASEGEIMRGYKIVDGKKTTFFNHTLDEKTKELIGDIAPKKIEASDVTTAANLNGRSVWNTAGTFESIGYTAYAKETIEKLLKDIQVTVTDGHTISINEVKELSGDAEIASNRGKRKHIYDMSIKCGWLISFTNGNSYEGDIKIDDVTADREYEFSLTYDKSSPKYNSEVEGVISSHIKSKDGLKAAIVEKLITFDNEFKSK